MLMACPAFGTQISGRETDKVSGEARKKAGPSSSPVIINL